MNGRRPIGNILIAAAILLCGGLFRKISHFADCIGLQFIGHTTFYAIQQSLVFPVIHSVWTSHLKSPHNQMKVSKLWLAGDGRCDSPGYSATYGTYTVTTEAGVIVDFQLTHVSETKNNSGVMERL